MAGGAAGAIDFIYATAMTMMGGQPPTRPWMGVAAALFGKATVVQIGTPMAAVGAALHFLITIGAAAVFYLTAIRQRFLVKHRLVSAVVFGILFFLAMNYVITPLSVIKHPLYQGARTISAALLTHVVVIGFPISLIVGWRLTGTGRADPAIRSPSQPERA
jgi:hypothetical protein